jgi:hypothetical protein
MNSCVPKVFGSMTPPQLALMVAGRAYAFAPVVFVREAAARPAHVGNVERLQCRHDIVAYTNQFWGGSRQL